VIIGMGNVALDCARILLSPIDKLAKTDITDLALDQLCHSRIKRVILVARRGPLQASFTIKELRELTKLNGVQPLLNADDFRSISSATLDKMERPRRRLTEFMMQTARPRTDTQTAERSWFLRFWRRPTRIQGSTVVESVECQQTEPISTDDSANENLAVRSLPTTETIPCGLVIKSIGYHGVQVCHDHASNDTHRPRIRSIHGCRSITNVVSFSISIVE
jgi:adrenodoxin-NADP+ reductase